MISPTRPGALDLNRAADLLAARVPTALAPLARLAYNYRWTWWKGGDELFASIDPHRWELCGANPVRLLQEVPFSHLERMAADTAAVRRTMVAEQRLSTELAAPLADVGIPAERPVAFFCAEYAVHASLPIYSGGLGVLAGDLVKAASDLGLPLVGVGLFYRQGYFRQRLDPSGYQHEYWIENDPERLPIALVTGDDGEPLTVTVQVWGRSITIQIWRVEVGRVPLYLLDTERSDNERIDRWICSRLYVGDRQLRLAQYAVLGLGGVRALRAMGIEPSVVHLNEGHAALAPLELVAPATADGVPFEEALATARHQTVFTTHTPVAAGNEMYEGEEVARALFALPPHLHTDMETLLALGRLHADQPTEPSGLTSLGLRVAGASNGVSRRHGEVARRMWRPLYPGLGVDEVPIGHITNGVHHLTWMAGPMRDLLDEHLGEGWEGAADDPATWAPVMRIPDAEVWHVRCEHRRALLEYVRDRAITDRLARGEPLDYAEASLQAFSTDDIVVGFARRLASYKRLHLVGSDPVRALQLIDGEQPMQLIIAGKAHPSDDEAKRLMQTLFRLKNAPHVAERVAFVEDYGMAEAAQLVAGCDVWLNLPRPPMEASGTSGMKSVMNGGLQLSVLDGWWAEAYGEVDGVANGWAIDGDESPDHAEQDARHGQMLFDILQHQVIPMFNERDDRGVPVRWVRMVKASLTTLAPRFSAARMLRDYVDVYAAAAAPKS
ncbi:MAG: alpha-glucan family phosphorylase [Acidimicrobiales bacterium]|nr:alpha-glucan family phosphorylase [Acidimicrobiales bacterium]